MNRRLAISFSGGETSAYMANLVLTEFIDLYDEILVIFMNTSREREEALFFVDRCDREIFRPLGYPVVWLEAVTYRGQRKGCGAKVVDFASAARTGSVYEAVIGKYGIPNQSYPHCNRELKLNPFNAYLRSIGWPAGSYDTAIGIRADEIDRMTVDYKKKRIVYPLISWRPTRKVDVNAWFASQPFRLNLKGYQGNCVDCWKKSDRKLFQIAKENPQVFLWADEMERKYDTVRGDTRRFYRGNRSAGEMVWRAFTTDFDPPTDDSQTYDVELDTGGACDGGESCDLFSGEDE